MTLRRYVRVASIIPDWESYALLIPNPDEVGPSLLAQTPKKTGLNCKICGSAEYPKQF